MFVVQAIDKMTLEASHESPLTLELAYLTLLPKVMGREFFQGIVTKQSSDTVTLSHLKRINQKLEAFPFLITKPCFVIVSCVTARTQQSARSPFEVTLQDEMSDDELGIKFPSVPTTDDVQIKDFLTLLKKSFQGNISPIQQDFQQAITDLAGALKGSGGNAVDIVFHNYYSQFRIIEQILSRTCESVLQISSTLAKSELTSRIHEIVDAYTKEIALDLANLVNHAIQKVLDSPANVCA